MASSASLSLPSSLRSQLQASLTQALTNKSVAQSHLYTAQASFRTADAANVAASSRLLDFKVGPAVPDKGQSPDPSSSWLGSDGSEGTVEEQSGLFLVLVRGQRNAQRAFEVARDRVDGAQEVFAGACMAVRDMRRALAEAEAEMEIKSGSSADGAEMDVD